MSERLMAVFRPQAWRNDHAVNIDGELTFDATAKVLNQPVDWIRDFQENTYDSDFLVEHEPCWESHRGPFEVDVDVAGWLEKQGLEQSTLTQEQLEELRRRFLPGPADGHEQAEPLFATEFPPSKRYFHFDIGDSCPGPIGICARVEATSEEEAVRRLRSLLMAQLSSIGHVELFSTTDEYAAIYVNPTAIDKDDIDEVD